MRLVALALLLSACGGVEFADVKQKCPYVAAQTIKCEASCLPTATCKPALWTLTWADGTSESYCGDAPDAQYRQLKTCTGEHGG